MGTLVPVVEEGTAAPAELMTDLGGYVAKACADAASQVVKEQATLLAQCANVIDVKIKAFNAVAIEARKQVEASAQLRVDLVQREAALSRAAANQRVPVRVLALIALATSCVLWGYSVLTPDLGRTIAATIFSIVSLGPLIALLWRHPT